ncbi:hypothetical protein BDZ91DRAFT_802368 [Kalaharituber pfeilii]|nr:hypothetical protein BDZ91DRAFT_802368 [Kalaharituber pfeilii]
MSFYAYAAMQAGYCYTARMLPCRMYSAICERLALPSRDKHETISLLAEADTAEFERAIAQAEDEGWTTLYTDGSRMDDKSGAGTFTMGEALTQQGGELLIVTDSKVAISKLTKIPQGDPTHEGAAQLVRDAWEARATRGDLGVAILWVKSHKGIKGNTAADEAAKLGVHLPYQDEVVTEAGIRQTTDETWMQSLHAGRPTRWEIPEELAVHDWQSGHPGVPVLSPGPSRTNGTPVNQEEWERHIDQNTDEGWTPVYTDGSVRGGKAGAGACWGENEEAWYLGEEATVNDAELVAISETMERVEGELLILTDSRHAIGRMRAVAGGGPAHDGATRKMRKAWETRVGRGDMDVAVMWVKAHRGIEGNERADRTAEWGTALQYKTEVVTEAGQRQRARRERAEERNRLKIVYRPLERAGREIGRLAGLLGGKGLRAWRWQIGEGDGPECRWCGESDETTEHLLGGCRVWRRRWPGGEEHIRCPPKKREGGRDPIEELLAMLGE